MINGDVLGKRFRFGSSCDDLRISPLTSQYECPRPSLLIITSGSENHLTCLEPTSYSVILCTLYSGGRGCTPRHTLLACFKHSNLFKVNVPVRLDTERLHMGVAPSTATGIPTCEAGNRRPARMKPWNPDRGREPGQSPAEPPPTGHFAGAPVDTAVER